MFPVHKRKNARDLRSDDDGAVAVEFTIITPVMLVLLLGSVELALLVWTKTDVAESVTAAADLTGQFTSIDDVQTASIFDAAERIIRPTGDVAGLEVTITSVLTCRCEDDDDQFCFSVVWSQGYRDGELVPGFPAGQEITDLSQDYGVMDNTTFILSDVIYDYRPPLSFVLFKDQTVELEDRYAVQPRLSREVRHIGSLAANEPVICAS